jgi:hypothetical protein
MPDPIVLCDANVLYSILLTDLVLSLGEAGLYRSLRLRARNRWV